MPLNVQSWAPACTSFHLFVGKIFFQTQSRWAKWASLFWASFILQRTKMRKRGHTLTQPTVSLYGEKNFAPQKTCESLFSLFPFDVSTFPLAYVEVTCVDIAFFKFGQSGQQSHRSRQDWRKRSATASEGRWFIGDWLYLDNGWARASEFLLFCFFSLDTDLNCCVSVLGDAAVQRLRLGSAGTDGDHTDRKPTHRWTVVSFLSWHSWWLLGVYFKRRRAAESTGTLNQRLLLQWGHSAWMFFPSKQWQIHLRNRLTRTPLSQCPQLKLNLLCIYCPTFSLPSRLASNSEVRISGQHYESLWTCAPSLAGIMKNLKVWRSTGGHRLEWPHSKPWQHNLFSHSWSWTVSEWLAGLFSCSWAIRLVPLLIFPSPSRLSEGLIRAVAESRRL